MHLLDLMQNSLAAGASRLDLLVREDDGRTLIVKLRDNGRGMDAATIKAVFDPFYTSRQTRRVGLGLPLLRATAEATGGTVEIESTPGRGTEVLARFGLDHLDCPPMGDLATTLTTVICGHAGVDVHVRIETARGDFELDSGDLRRRLRPADLGEPPVYAWLNNCLKHEIEQLYGGASR